MTRKYPLRGYILGVLTHTTAWDQLLKGDETLKNCHQNISFEQGNYLKSHLDNFSRLSLKSRAVKAMMQDSN